MKNKLFPVLFALPITTGICGALLRASQFTHAYDPQTGILKNGEPVTYGLLAVCIIAVLMAIIAAFLLKRGVEFNTVHLPLFVKASMSLSSVVILIYAGITFFSLRENFDAAKLVLGLFSVYTSVALLVMGKYQLSERESTAYCIFSAVPAFWACFMLILTFREKISDPIIANYVPLMFSYISILFFSYSLCAHVLGKSKKHIAVFFCFVGIFFILIEALSLIFAGDYITYNADKLRELLPQIAFLILMPATTAQMIQNNQKG